LVQPNFYAAKLFAGQALLGGLSRILSPWIQAGFIIVGICECESFRLRIYALDSPFGQGGPKNFAWQAMKQRFLGQFKLFQKTAGAREQPANGAPDLEGKTVRHLGAQGFAECARCIAASVFLGVEPPFSISRLFLQALHNIGRNFLDIDMLAMKAEGYS
jgi:hypothetical protein